MKRIIKVIEVENYSVKTLWNDGNIRDIELLDFILKKSKNPDSSYSQLINKSIFETVKCDGTTLSWDNLIDYVDLDGSIKKGELDISPELLFELTESYISEKSLICR